MGSASALSSQRPILGEVSPRAWLGGGGGRGAPVGPVEMDGSGRASGRPFVLGTGRDGHVAGAGLGGLGPLLHPAFFPPDDLRPAQPGDRVVHNRPRPGYRFFKGRVRGWSPEYSAPPAGPLTSSIQDGLRFIRPSSALLPYRKVSGLFAGLHFIRLEVSGLFVDNRPAGHPDVNNVGRVHDLRQELLSSARLLLVRPPAEVGHGSTGAPRRPPIELRRSVERLGAPRLPPVLPGRAQRRFDGRCSTSGPVL